jgi:hypothetical protein
MADAGIVRGERVAIVHLIDADGARLVRMADLQLMPRPVEVLELDQHCPPHRDLGAILERATHG